MMSTISTRPFKNFPQTLKEKLLMRKAETHNLKKDKTRSYFQVTGFFPASLPCVTTFPALPAGVKKYLRPRLSHQGQSSAGVCPHVGWDSPKEIKRQIGAEPRGDSGEGASPTKSPSGSSSGLPGPNGPARQPCPRPDGFQPWTEVRAQRDTRSNPGARLPEKK